MEKYKTPTAFVLTIPLHLDFTARNSDIAEILVSTADQLGTNFEHVVEPDDRDTVMQDDRISLAGQSNRHRAQH